MQPILWQTETNVVRRQQLKHDAVVGVVVKQLEQRQQLSEVRII